MSQAPTSLKLPRIVCFRFLAVCFRLYDRIKASASASLLSNVNVRPAAVAVKTSLFFNGCSDMCCVVESNGAGKAM